MTTSYPCVYWKWLGIRKFSQTVSFLLIFTGLSMSTNQLINYHKPFFVKADNGTCMLSAKFVHTIIIMLPIITGLDLSMVCININYLYTQLEMQLFWFLFVNFQINSQYFTLKMMNHEQKEMYNISLLHGKRMAFAPIVSIIY